MGLVGSPQPVVLLAYTGWVDYRDDRMNTSENPAELFGLRLAHVGINTNTPEEAASTADALCALLGIERGEEHLIQALAFHTKLNDTHMQGVTLFALSGVRLHQEQPTEALRAAQAAARFLRGEQRYPGDKSWKGRWVRRWKRSRKEEERQVCARGPRIGVNWRCTMLCWYVDLDTQERRLDFCSQMNT